MSSDFRVTQRSITTTVMRGLQANQARMQQIQEQLSSGRQVNRPSDSPVKTVEAMQFRGTLSRTQQYIRNADDGIALLNTADVALVQGLDITRRVRDLTLQGMNASSNALGREAIAVEIESLRDGLLAVANTKYLDRPVFGGNTGGSSAYSTPSDGNPGGAYTGDGGAALRTIAAGTQVEVNVTGPQAFGEDGENAQVFEVLNGLIAHFRGKPEDAGAVTDLQVGVSQLDRAVDRLIGAVAKVGARLNRVEAMKTKAEDSMVTLTNSLSEVENIDLPKTIMELQMQEVAYQAALGATARVVQPSLLDFLR